MVDMEDDMITDRFCVMTRPYGHWTLEYASNSMEASGFSNVEFWAASPHYCYADYTAEERKQRREYIKELFQLHGLSIKVFCPEQMNDYPLNIASENEYVREQSIEIMLDYVEDTAFFGAGVMVLDPGWRPLDIKDDAYIDRAVDAIKRIGEKAKSKGIDIAIEPLARATGALVYDLPTLCSILKAVDMDNVKACIDLGEILSAEERLEDWYEALKGKIAHARFSDKGGSVPGTKSDEVGPALDMLDKLGYRGCASINITFRDNCLTADKELFYSAKWLQDEFDK